MAEKRSGFRLCAICVLCGLLLSCAAQSPPQPPRVERPVPVRDLTAGQVGNKIVLRFTSPAQAVDGEDLTKPVEVEIFRSTWPLLPPGTIVDVSPQKGTQEKPWTLLGPADLTRYTVGGRVEYADRLSSADFKKLLGWKIDYRVRPLTRGFRNRPIVARFDASATVTLLDVPQPVAGLTVRATKDALELRWSAPSETLTGQASGPISSYRVYRSEGDSASAARTSPYRVVGNAHETSYADENFEFGRAYSYKVRAVVTGKGTPAESDDSAAIEIVPRDVFPPTAPAGLTGLYTSGAIELVWSPNSERDLAGYNVRRREGQGKPERLNRELLRSPLYRDTTVTPGHHYFYQVTAVDSSGNESAASPEIEVEAQ